ICEETAIGICNFFILNRCELGYITPIKIGNPELIRLNADSPIQICENGYVCFTIFFRASVQSMTRPGKMVENYRRPHLDRDFADNRRMTGCHPEI
ncbi:MAG TPA: hypothetical protein VEP90_05610, partial [Methylomirabilota bacterium]|nr:hypothetical protein [Methylomirabilota bacterium]